MKILYVCHRFPYPPQRGGKIRPFNTIKHLSGSHEVTVASLVRSAAEAASAEGLAAHCKTMIMEPIRRSTALLNMIRRLPSRIPSSTGYFHSSRLAKRIAAELASFPYDFIFVHCAFVAAYVAHARGIPKLLDFGDIDSQKWLAYAETKPFPLSLGYYLEGAKMQCAEMRFARQFDYYTCTTPAELRTLEAFDPGAPATWFPNGVDTDYFAPIGDSYDADTIAFVGRMDYFPNQECVRAFCRDSLPLIRAQRPAVKLLVVGANPSRSIRKLAALPGVTVTGSVVDIPPIVQRVALTIAPLNIARGTQNKILESLAMGVPVICSPRAAAGVDAVPAQHLLTATTPREYADAILTVLNSPEKRRELADAGRSRMLSHHSWTRSMKKLDTIIDECLTSATNSRSRARTVPR